MTVNGIAMLSAKNADIFNENLGNFFLSVALASTIKYQSALICGCAGLVFLVMLYQKTRWVDLLHSVSRNRIILICVILAILTSVGITLTVNVQLFDHLVPIFSRTDVTSVLFDNQFYSQKATIPSLDILVVFEC